MEPSGLTHGSYVTSAGNVIHEAENAGAAVILASGTFGGVDGPSGVYEELAWRLQVNRITCLRLNYKRLHKIDPCVLDVLAAIESLESRGISQMILVGWSFGAAVVLSAALKSTSVIGVAMIAGHRYKSQGVAQLSPKRLLLLHGTADEVISVEHAQALYEMASEPKELVLFEDGDHYFSKHASALVAKLFDCCRDLFQKPI